MGCYPILGLARVCREHFAAADPATRSQGQPGGEVMGGAPAAQIGRRLTAVPGRGQCHGSG